MESFLQDTKFGLRKLLSDRGTAFLVVLMLALGIGANTAIFSALRGSLLAGLPYDNRCRVLGTIVQRPPNFVTIGPPQGNDARAITSADVQNHHVFIDQRRRGDSPNRHAVFRAAIPLNLEITVEITLPQNFAVLGVEAVQVPHCSQRERLAIVDGHRCPRTSLITNAAVFTRIAVLPKQLAVGGVKAQHTLCLFGFGLAVRQIDALTNPRGTAVSRANFCLPARL